MDETRSRANCSELIIGMWVAYSESGLVETIGREHLYCWKTKRDALEDLMAYKLEPRKHPKICRVAPGEYEYTPGDCDNWGKDRGVVYTIERVTKQNIAEFKSWLDYDESY